MRQLKITASITSRDSDSLEKYLSEISRIDLISPEEEAALARQIREGSDEALEKLTKANLRFVVSVAKQYQGQGLSLSDLINEGNVGLIKAAKRFDETKGFKFISYAVWWIRQSIMLAIVEQARLVRMPLNKVGSYSRLNRLSQQLEQEYEREPTLEELAEIMHMKEDEVKDITRGHHRHVSVDAPLGDSEEGSMLDTMSDTDDRSSPDKDLVSDSLKKEIEEVLNVLNYREREIIAAYFGINGTPQMNLEEIAESLDLTKERVRQIKERAIRRLRKTTTSTELKSYL
ncbi:MAG: RNA polymerase sigma factor RpoD/SigA [Chitinophagales bacterium]|nr:RNA polymerase sigma factor RpoD/SigA [Chitinophagales bacterium]HAE14173.1 RNA polymerase subunit sigma [Bacteroidota bacterium]MCB9018906.1 RNA polymerase sigma factor RpoD/SigA [Chitinophagales bacterium]MCB9022584.1 RNA polymerase sigma factor RpoD/SigA [Chitinophagales bacterium]HAE34745.1 RNA polymerase subunit sigma [Bacteroidota bacterium]